MSDQPSAGSGLGTDGTGEYAEVNGLRMYYEIHGTGDPLVLLHGAFSAIETSFGLLLPELAKSHRVIAVELQGHGRTADIDRPLTIEGMAEDTANLMQHLGIPKADFFGYSMGSAVAMELAMRRPDLVRKVVLVTVCYTPGGLIPGLLAGIEQMTPEALAGSPFEAEYMRTAPRPEDWPNLVRKVKQMDANIKAYPPEAVAGIEAPVLLVIGDSDIVRPEHAVEMYRLLRSDAPWDGMTLSRSQLAVLPGTSHLSIMNRADLLLAIVPRFLEATEPAG